MCQNQMLYIGDSPAPPQSPGSPGSATTRARAVASCPPRTASWSVVSPRRLVARVRARNEGGEVEEDAVTRRVTTLWAERWSGVSSVASRAARRPEPRRSRSDARNHVQERGCGGEVEMETRLGLGGWGREWPNGDQNGAHGSWGSRELGLPAACTFSQKPLCFSHLERAPISRIFTLSRINYQEERMQTQKKQESGPHDAGPLRY
ncbi:hypothetical protein GUJ93_ZPchr0002g23769 [Zizania palustris]|uniref:Uncharacterized protein n=1 Tax=Zizania palustris TaxID=103762 RepID=A0A8J5S2D9_ZIZPA|nr:hypothetical protein GUJ93_ZPchr0002g23769 [Zizania palustris]